MTSYYIRNLSGCTGLSEEKKGTITRPYFELYTHVTLKTAQAGTILGAGLIGPIVSVAQGKRDCASIEQAAYKYGKNGLLVGLVLGPVLTFARTASLDRQGVHDRTYQLRFNRNQVFVDRMSLLGALAGTGVAQYLGKELGVGALFGFGGGCFCAGLLNTIF